MSLLKIGSKCKITVSRINEFNRVPYIKMLRSFVHTNGNQFIIKEMDSSGTIKRISTLDGKKIWPEIGMNCTGIKKTSRVYPMIELLPIDIDSIKRQIEHFISTNQDKTIDELGQITLGHIINNATERKNKIKTEMDLIDEEIGRLQAKSDALYDELEILTDGK